MLIPDPSPAGQSTQRRISRTCDITRHYRNAGRSAEGDIFPPYIIKEVHHESRAGGLSVPPIHICVPAENVSTAYSCATALLGAAQPPNFARARNLGRIYRLLMVTTKKTARLALKS